LDNLALKTVKTCCCSNRKYTMTGTTMKRLFTNLIPKKLLSTFWNQAKPAAFKSPAKAKKVLLWY
jgi:hypothetical protein